ncbi:LuxR family transcriptional regulator [Sinomonas atrocyanea]|uniref:LuxR family transcriptional regulator n=1 Tax=Sinomonas atrocyanea TaxID=37927 RepID=A0A127A0G1_9MICC|nr:response regulator transcription factor [Sinomonas atrocyanea]AMM32899.1 LuxR family transcriptional regulator [Sinomonas atrocyanea]GEB65020.1 DNA-binding response regulator [Sinomonas atrocyanea]GGG61422.1 DNA-binding response regulator [Sinomonas atrocyanea]
MDSSDEAIEAIRVYLLDGHEVSRRGLRDLLEEQGMVVVGESETAAEAAARIPALRPDVAVLDARPAGGAGIEVCRRIRSIDKSIRCLILAEDHDEQVFRKTVLAGASGYLVKQLSGQDIAAAVRRAAAGEVLFDPEEEDRILSAAIEARQSRPGAYEGLTPKESRVLELLGQGMTNRQIADEMVLAEKTAKNYVSAVLAKLGLHHRTQAALYVAQAERRRHGPHA